MVIPWMDVFLTNYMKPSWLAKGLMQRLHGRLNFLKLPLSFQPKKLGEESAEAIIEAIKGDRQGLTMEAADVIYHLLVLMAATDVKPEAVWAELERRQAQSGIAEKAIENNIH